MVMRITFVFLFFTFISCTKNGCKDRWDNSRDGWSPLMLAIYDDDPEEYTKLIEQNVDLNFVSEDPNTNWNLTAMEVAIFKDNDSAVKKLLATGKVTNPEKYFMHACGQNNASTVGLLLKYGANPNETLDNGYSVLMMSASFGSLEVLECLLKNGANTNQKRSTDGMTALMFASSNGEPKKVKLLLKYGAKKDTKDLNGKKALDNVEYLIQDEQISKKSIDELKMLLK